MLIIPVADEETLYRHVPRVAGLYLVQADGSVKISSAAFSDRSFRPSVDRAELCHNDPRKTQPCPNQSVFRKLAERLAQLANERPWEIALQDLT